LIDILLPYFQAGRHSLLHCLASVFDSRLVLQRCFGKLEDALARGYSGMRVSGDLTWLDKNDWMSFMDCEAAANGTIGKHKMLALCTHCLEKCGAA